MTTVREALKNMREAFCQAGIERPALDSRLLLQDILNMPPEDIILRGDDVMTDQAMEKWRGYQQRRLAHEPVSRILGHRCFWKSKFKISPATLDPRADSETLIEAVLNNIQLPHRILDLGTGSGCLLLSLLQEYPEATGVGLDISADAVRIAKENAAHLSLEDRAGFVTDDWEKFKPDIPFDVVVSNPPYITEDEMTDLARDVRDYDPHVALVAGKDGLCAYRSIIKRLPGLLTPSGTVFFEVGREQGEKVGNLLEQGGFYVIQTLTDLAGNDRCVIAKPLNKR